MGRKGTYFEVKCLVGFSISKFGSTNSVIIFNPLESSTDITRGGGLRPSAEECLSRMVLVTSARLLADKTDNEVGGLLLPTPTPSLEDTDDIEPPELGKDR